jgi:hypothetical protein
MNIRVSDASAPPPGVECVRSDYSRCSALGITELLVGRARQEPPGVKLALLDIWRTILASLGADVRPLEPLWVEAGLDPSAVVMPEDRSRAETVAEEALAQCRVCTVGLQAFLRLLNRITLAEKPDGDALLVVEIVYNGVEVAVATKLNSWIKETKEGIRYAIPLLLRERLRQVGLAVDAAARDLYTELTRRAERYVTTVDAYLRPILLHAAEALRAAPHLAKCARDRRIVYIASELLKTALWYFDARIGLGRNKLYESLRRYGLLASAGTVVADFTDEYGQRVKKRALPFFVDKLAEFIDVDIRSICPTAGMTVNEEERSEEKGAEPQAVPPKEGA